MGDYHNDHLLAAGSILILRVILLAAAAIIVIALSGCSTNKHNSSLPTTAPSYQMYRVLPDGHVVPATRPAPAGPPV